MVAWSEVVGGFGADHPRVERARVSPVATLAGKEGNHDLAGRGSAARFAGVQLEVVGRGRGRGERASPAWFKITTRPARVGRR